MFIVGLTGGIGSGKSTVATLFAKYNVPIVDMDQIARDIVAPKTLLEKEIIEHFGNSVSTSNGELNRKALGQKIFNNYAARKWLEKLLHPTIWSLAEKETKQSMSEYVILVAPLLIESNATNKVDRVLAVHTDPTIQIHRTRERDQLATDAILAIISAQTTYKQRLKYADDIIDNSTDLEELKDSVALLHTRYLKEARSNHDK